MRTLVRRVKHGGLIAFVCGLVGAAAFTGTPSAFASSSLTVTQEQLLFMPIQNQSSFAVIEVLDVRNDSATVDNIQVSVPDGIQSLSALGVNKSNLVSGVGVVTLRHDALPHTTTKVTLTYTLPLQGQTNIQFTLHSFYAVDAAHLYLIIGGSALSATGLLPDTQTEDISGTTFRIFTRPGIPAGDDWPLSIELLPTATSGNPTKGLPILGADSQGSGNTLQALGNLAIAAFILVIGMISIRSTQWGPSAKGQLSQEEALYRVWESAEWQHEQGMFDEAQIEQRRHAFRRRLAEMKLSTDEEK